MSAIPVPSKKPNIKLPSGMGGGFFFTMSYAKCVCLICQSTIATPKKGNVERHFWTVHRNYDTDFPPVHQHVLYI